MRQRWYRMWHRHSEVAYAGVGLVVLWSRRWNPTPRTTSLIFTAVNVDGEMPTATFHPGHVTMLKEGFMNHQLNILERLLTSRDDRTRESVLAVMRLIGAEEM